MWITDPQNVINFYNVYTYVYTYMVSNIVNLNI